MLAENITGMYVDEWKKFIKCDVLLLLFAVDLGSLFVCNNRRKIFFCDLLGQKIRI